MSDSATVQKLSQQRRHHNEEVKKITEQIEVERAKEKYLATKPALDDLRALLDRHGAALGDCGPIRDVVRASHMRQESRLERIRRADPEWVFDNE